MYCNNVYIKLAVNMEARGGDPYAVTGRRQKSKNGESGCPFTFLTCSCYAARNGANDVLKVAVTGGQR